MLRCADFRNAQIEMPQNGYFILSENGKIDSLLRILMILLFAQSHHETRLHFHIAGQLLI